MLKIEIININGAEYQRTLSDAGFKIERDGIRYDEAIDPIDSGRTYTETDERIEADSTDEATEADYINALSEIGVIE